MCPIHFRWEETYTPTTLPRSRSPHNVLHSPSYYTEVISIRVSEIPPKILGGMPQDFAPLNVCFACYLESCHPLPPLANILQLDLLQGRTSLKQLPLALHYTDACRHMHERIHAHTETDTCIRR